jgi:hypothetical protein
MIKEEALQISKSLRAKAASRLAKAMGATDELDLQLIDGIVKDIVEATVYECAARFGLISFINR